MAQLVARTAGGGEVAGSSPVIPTRDDIIVEQSIGQSLVVSYLIELREESPGSVGQDGC